MQYLLKRYKEDAEGGAYQTLGHAIVERAVEDYKNLGDMANIEHRYHCRVQLKKFFISDWCYLLCGIDKGTWQDFIKKYDIKK